METGIRSIQLTIDNKSMTVFNQRSKLWQHHYDYITPQKATLSSAGCGVFSICHCGQYLTGREFVPEDLADFSMANGGRGDDGTDRPALLAAMQEKGLAKEYGFYYNGDGLRNDLDTLREHLLRKRGVALCNLRVGHIVALLGARKVSDTVQVLALDSYSESMHERVVEHVYEVYEESKIVSDVYNDTGVKVGEKHQYALYWADSAIVRDFNLLHAL